jgi:hypothetical protein
VAAVKPKIHKAIAMVHMLSLSKIHVKNVAAAKLRIRRVTAMVHMLSNFKLLKNPH